MHHSSRLLQPGCNCWRIEHASRFSMLVDAEVYFRALRQAILKAGHSVFIPSWDIDSQLWLVPQGAAGLQRLFMRRSNAQAQ